MTTRRRKAAFLASALLLFTAVFLPAQTANDSIPPAAPAKAQFFAGIVMELDQQHIKVSRTLVGRSPEIRTFLVNPSTKMNQNSVKINARVTVRYRRQAEGDIAIEIQLRPSVRTPKTS